MIRSSELELHARAKELYERENPGRLWRVPPGALPNPVRPYRLAGLIERQNYLARIRDQMRAEGIVLETEENPPQPRLGG